MLITGMSGAGKSSVVEELARRGYRAVDLDHPDWSEWRADEAGEPDWVWREDRVRDLLEGAGPGPLFVSGCMTHQGRFYPLLDRVVLLSAPLEVLLARVSTRTGNPYGQRPEERAQIAGYVATVEPLLRAGCHHEFDTSHLTLAELADALQALAGR